MGPASLLHGSYGFILSFMFDERFDIDLDAVRGFLRNKELARSRLLDERFAQASSDFSRLVDMIIKKFSPNRIYQWGSLLDRELIGIIEKQILRMDALYASIADAFDRDVAVLGRTGNAAVMIAGLFENYYTCMETAFQKISQHFENHLEPARWLWLIYGISLSF